MAKEKRSLPENVEKATKQPDCTILTRFIRLTRQQAKTNIQILYLLR